MKTFIKVYNDLIFEAEFKSKKWIETGKIKSIIVKENIKHLSDRIKIRYEINFYEWAEWAIIKKLIVLHLLKVNLWLKCSKKNPFGKGWTCHLIESNMWLSGIVQNDLDDKVQRIYFSTFLPEKPKINPYDYYFELPL